MRYVGVTPIEKFTTVGTIGVPFTAGKFLDVSELADALSDIGGYSVKIKEAKCVKVEDNINVAVFEIEYDTTCILTLNGNVITVVRLTK